ncbi:tRNA 2-thiouridine(34) synthase MnmA [Selenomonas sputigena]|uniref:tRNA-specific 2-thiouridylase MnmA n=1 Tax=Selenomonas sputigena TaxID=69823 RepID=A0ABV3X1F5_9FIRM
MKKKAAVAMSGGVDSSLCAALLKEQGYEVIGITMRLSDESRETDGLSTAAVDAKRVADFLGIEHETADFRELFGRRVVDCFLDEYLAGRTPNPCVICNRFLKFGALFALARERGADFIATGHYARVEEEADGSFAIKKGRDERKDQSYVLYRLPREVLPHILFPLGEQAKTETRALAETLGLPVAHKTESQEICFVPGDDYKAYLMRHRPDCFSPGEIVDAAGNVLGQHAGLPFYTIGQRRGLGIAAPHPLYVAALDRENNRVIVAENAAVYASALLAEDVNWLIAPPAVPLSVRAKIRYGSREAEARVTPLASGRIEVTFAEAQRAVTPGQSVVFYAGERLLGGATIRRSL